MRLFKRIISLFLAFVICTSLCLTSVFAAWYNDAAYRYTQSSLLQWGVHTIVDVAGFKGGTYVGTVLIPGLGSVAGSVIGTSLAQLANQGIDAVMEYLAQDSSFVTEDDYIDSLPFPEVSSEGELIVPCFHFQFFVEPGGSIRNSSSCGHNFDASGNLTFKPGQYDEDLFSFNCDTSSVTFLEDFSGDVNIVWGFIPPVAGTYSNVWPVVSTGTAQDYPVVVSDDQVGDDYQVTGTMVLSVDRDAGETLTLSPCYMVLDSTPVDFEEDEDYSYQTRPSWLTQQIYNYNYSDNSTTKYGIGIVDDSGDVTNVFDINIFNEETLTFTEPVTGNQYLCTGWTYDYDTRTYHLELVEHTLVMSDDSGDRYWISDVDITYGDEELTISYYSGRTLIRTDTYAYIIATPDTEVCQHEFTSEVTVDPTCEEPGETTYTCSICGYEYTEQLDPLGHDWRLVGSYPAEFDDEGSVTEYAYTLYECSRCKEQYKDYASTGPPQEDDDSWLDWLLDLFKSLIEALVNGLASGLEYLVSTVIVTVTDLIIQTIQWVFGLFDADNLISFFGWFSDSNATFQAEFGPAEEVDVWAYS